MSRKRLNEFDTLAPAHDARTGHGYGRTGPPNASGGEHLAGAVYPYGTVEEEDWEEEEMDWEDLDLLDDFIKATGMHFQSRDAYGGRGSIDRSSFAHSSTRGLGESGMHPAKGMVPFPRMYKKSKGNGTTTAGITTTGVPGWSVYRTGPGRYGGKGTKKGYFSPPPPMLSAEEDNVYSLDDIPTHMDKQMKQIQMDYDDFITQFTTSEDFEQEETEALEPDEHDSVDSYGQ